MAEILVDVVAMAGLLGGQAHGIAQVATSGAPPQGMGVTIQGTGQEAQECPLGHQSTTAARFCPECGLPMGEVRLAPRVDLNAVREAVLPAHALDAEAKARRDQQHIEALAMNARIEQEIEDFAAQQDPSRQQVHIHFVTDGFTWAGQVWYAGQEIKIGPEHPRWPSALGWIRLTKSEQYQRYGKVFFDLGPFPGRSAPPGTEMKLPTAGVEQWSAVRGGGVPASASPDGDGSLIPR